jgi:Tfp pilus assembly protein FimV
VSPSATASDPDRVPPAPGAPIDPEPSATIPPDPARSGPRAATVTPVGPANPTPSGGDPGTIRTVVSGDSLWTIAADHLATTRGQDRAALSTDEIAAYWVEVCSLNHDRLRSGDRSLIHPGETVMLPPV